MESEALESKQKHNFILSFSDWLSLTLMECPSPLPARTDVQRILSSALGLVLYMYIGSFWFCWLVAFVSVQPGKASCLLQITFSNGKLPLVLGMPWIPRSSVQISKVRRRWLVLPSFSYRPLLCWGALLSFLFPSLPVPVCLYWGLSPYCGLCNSFVM